MFLIIALITIGILIGVKGDIGKIPKPLLILTCVFLALMLVGFLVQIGTAP